MSTEVDTFWHAHILHTRDYHEFYNKVYGQYIHHTPLDEEDEQKVAEVANLYEYTYNIYHRTFNFVNTKWWPHPETRPLICLHFAVDNPEVKRNALFEKDHATILTLQS